MFGLVALAAFAWLWVLSATPLDPPNWVRILGLVFLPIGLLGAVVTGIAGLRGARGWAVFGLVAAGLTIVAFIVLNIRFSERHGYRG
ncbi:hypothetical protein [Agromyces bauzanensis]|uniref:Uncharacterized protein n=1 Tax=Agromyces bauzanensis TaxID=1308924 RepID=A0A917PFW7_9MICO|nr:hypothetical protein [Agromyces bauzanensis]GGJ75108.1 hypothetical protein GCM10011372_11480 [Agromyces bauzanensis]